jgi:hypothetical protein
MAISKIDGTGLSSGLTGVTLTSPVLTTPNLGTPSALVLTNATSLPSSALPSGTVKQVLSIEMTATGSYSTNGTTAATPLTLSITPSSTSSRVFITGRIATGGGDTWTGGGFTIYRNSTNLNNAVNGTSGTNSGMMMLFWNPYDGQTNANQKNPYAINHIPISFVDSPNTTSSTTYTVYATGVGGATPVTLNVSYNGSMRATSQLIIMEIA